MAQRDKLFSLISSLSRSEKRFVRLQAGLHANTGNKRYMELFDAIEAQSEYDEDALRQKFGGEADNFAALKHYLYQAILKALYLMKLESLPEARAVMLNIQADILAKKGLKDQSMALLRKSKKYAQANSLPALAIASLLRSFSHYIVKDVSHFSKELDVILVEVKQYSSEYTEYLQTLPLVKQCYVAMSTNFRPRNQEELQLYKQVLYDAEQFNPESMTSILGRRNVLLSLATAHRMMGNSLAAVQVYANLYDLARDNMSSDRYNMTISAALLNTCISCVEARAEAKFYHYYQLLLEEGQRLLQRGDKHFLAESHLLDAYLLCEKGAFTEAVDSINGAEDLIERSGWRLDLEHELFKHQMRAVALFGVGKFHEAIAALHTLFAYPNVRQLSRQRYFSSRILLLIAHFELGNLEALEALLPAIWSQMQARGQVYRLEENLRQFFRRVIQLGSTQLPQEQWESIHSAMQELTQDVYELGALVWFNVPLWVRSKYEGRDFADLVSTEWAL